MVKKKRRKCPSCNGKGVKLKYVSMFYYKEITCLKCAGTCYVDN